MLSLWKKVIIILVIATSLSGCLAVGAAAVGAAAAAIVFDRRSLAASLDDQSLTQKISAAIQDDEELHTKSHIIVATFHRMVLLAGETPTKAMRTRATQIARSVPGIEQLYNEISIESPPSTLTAASDAWITTKIKSSLLTKDHLSSGQFKVITDNGIVYLMGVVSRSQADAAVELARRVSGVEKVVKIFKYRQPSPEEVLRSKAIEQENRAKQKAKTAKKSFKTALNDSDNYEDDLSNDVVAGTV